MEKKLRNLLFVIMLSGCFVCTSNAQTATFDFASSTYNTTTLGYVETGVGTYFKATTGGTTTISTLGTACNGYTQDATTGSSLFIFQATSTISAITVYATGTGSGRVLSSLTTSSTLGGTYAATTAGSTGTIASGVCGSIVITPAANVASGTFMKLTFSGNLNVTSVVLTLAVTTPTVTTTAISAITSSAASSGGNVTSDGNASVTAKGVCWSTSANPTVPGANSTSDGTGTGSYTSSITGLSSNTLYHVRAYATNSQGTSYGTDVQFTTNIITTTYYNAAGADVTSIANWGTNTDGTGSHPADFVTAGQVFNVINAGATVSTAWTVSGTSSKVVVGDGTNPVSFTIPAANSLTGTIDVNNNATLAIQNTTSPTFGTLASGSTVAFDGNGSLTIPAINYYNLLSTNDAGAARTLANAGTIGVAASFTPGSATYTTTGSTLSFNGSAAQSIPAFAFNNLSIDNGSTTTGGNITVNGALSVNQNFTESTVLTIGSAGSITIAASKTFTVNGTLDNQSITAITLTGAMTVAGTYKVDAAVANSYIIPAITFQTGSNLNILQGAPRIPQTVGGNVTWSSTGAGTFVNNATNTISGSFTVTNGQINNGSGGTGRTLTVGSLSIQGGEYDIAGSGASTANILNINGDMNVSGGTLYASATTTAGGTGVINVKGNVNHTAGTLGVATGVTSGTLVFNSSAAESFGTVGLSNALNITLGTTSPATTPVVTLSTNLTIPTGATLLNSNGSLIVSPNKVLTLAGTGNFNGKSVTLQSDATGTASIAQVTGTLSNATNVTVQQYLTAQRAYRLLGHPFNANVTLSLLQPYVDITGSGSGLTTGNASAFNYTTGVWSAYTANTQTWNANEALFLFVRGTPGQGVGVTNGSYTPSAPTISITGPVNTGNLNYTVKAAGTFGGAAVGWNAIGNPYPSAIDVNSVGNIAAPGGSGASIYVWVATMGSTGAGIASGGYDFHTLGSSIVIPEYGAFFIKNTSGVDQVINFTESNKSTGTPLSLFGASTTTAQSFLLTIADANTYWDRLKISFDDKSSTASTDQTDLEKFSNINLDFYSLASDNNRLAINSRPVLQSVTDIIPLGLKTNQQRTFTVTANEVNLATGSNLYLHDKYTNSWMKIANGVSYSFSVTADTASQGNNRFEVVMKTSEQLVVVTPAPIAPTALTVEAGPSPMNSVLTIRYASPEAMQTNIRITDISGKTVSSINAGKVQSGVQQVATDVWNSGVYVIQVSNGKEIVTKKVVKE